MNQVRKKKQSGWQQLGSTYVYQGVHSFLNGPNNNMTEAFQTYSTATALFYTMIQKWHLEQ